MFQNKLKQEKILITGLNGLTGWHLYLKAKDRFQVYGTYAKPHPVLKKPGLFRVNLDDAAQVEQLIVKTRPDYLIHARAICDLDLCEIKPEMAEFINVTATGKLLNSLAASGPGLKKFVYLSTDHVFNGERGNYTEEDRPSPKHVYGCSKLAAEKLILSSGLPSLIVRPGLVIGESFQGNKGPRDFLFSRIQANKPTHLFVDEWRTPIQAEDLAEQILNLMLSESTGVYHLAGLEARTRYDLGKHLARSHHLPLHQIHPRKRSEDRWAHIRPGNLTLLSIKKRTLHSF